MNKITRKRPDGIFIINWVRNNAVPDLTLTPQKINQSIKNYHIYYDKSRKKKLGKGKCK